MDKLKAFRCFVEVAEQGTMSAAARKLGVVNSVISKNINELEEWLGRKLVYRSTRNMRLTEKGLEYLEQINEILNKVYELENKDVEEDLPIHGIIKVTAPIYLGQKLLVPFLPDFHHQEME